MSLTDLLQMLAIVAVASPAFLFITLGSAALLGHSLSERTIARLTATSICTGLAASLAILLLMLTTGQRHLPVEIGDWVSLGGEEAHGGHHFHFTVSLLYDRLSIPFVILSFVLCGVIGAFANIYLHREPGYRRFYLLFSLFLLGMIVSSTAGTIEMLFVGWEMVGLSSALLVAFFQERPEPVRNGLRVWMVYRFSDAAFLIAIIAMHHLRGAGDFALLSGGGINPWPYSESVFTAHQTLLVGVLLLMAVAGKSALIPFSGWLPRAMEGPTPSSAVFYGALSVHLGVYLLLRVAPIFSESSFLWIVIVCWGLMTAIYAAITARVQTDIKSALAFASLTQIGLIVVEIGLGVRFGWGFWYLALVHLIGHACLRTLQFLRAPTLLRDYHQMENATGSRMSAMNYGKAVVTSTSLQKWVYRFGMERGYFDALLTDYVVRPFLSIFRLFQKLEDRWRNFFVTESESKNLSQVEQSLQQHQQAAAKNPLK